jgi:hypothetical protein
MCVGAIGPTLGAMDQTCLVIPLQPGAREAARGWLRTLGGPRAGELARSERRLGIARQAWFISGAGQDLLIGLIDAKDFPRAMSLLGISMEPFDLWFKRSMEAITGLDLNDPPLSDPATLLSRYAAESALIPVLAQTGPAA